ncbi:MAG TPA: hypothetical protein VJ350_04060 [Methanoregula sp.]|nr:hypothetical protein [Methanoregula sp.]
MPQCTDALQGLTLVLPQAKTCHVRMYTLSEGAPRQGDGMTIQQQSEPRKTDFAKATVNQVVKAGSRQVKQVNLYLTRGSFPIAFEPTLAEVTIT